MSQRDVILDALLQVLATRGIDALSVRTVAAAAEVSPAQVQYYFRTKTELLTAALTRVHERMDARLDRVDVRGSTDQVLRRFLLAWLPLDEERRTDATVWLAFTSAATTHPELAALVHDSDQSVLDALTGVISHGQGDKTLTAMMDPIEAATLLLAVVDGLTIRAISHPDVTDVVAILDRCLDTLLTHPSAKDHCVDPA